MTLSSFGQRMKISVKKARGVGVKKNAKTFLLVVIPYEVYYIFDNDQEMEFCIVAFPEIPSMHHF